MHKFSMRGHIARVQGGGSWTGLWIVVENLNKRLLHVSIINTSQLFGPKYRSRHEVGMNMLEQWLKTSIIKFKPAKSQCDASRVELLIEFVETLRHESENKSFTESWRFCGGIIEWYVNWLHLVELWNFVFFCTKALAMLACSCRLLLLQVHAFKLSSCTSMSVATAPCCCSGVRNFSSMEHLQEGFPSPGKVLGLREIFQIPCPEK